jgi:hypothetical protein
VKRDPTPPPGYLAACELTDEVVGHYKAAFKPLLDRGVNVPDFVFGPPDVAIAASLADVGYRLVRNTEARRLLVKLLEESERRNIDYPTVMMLQAALEMHGIRYARVSLEELRLPAELVGYPQWGDPQ